MVFRTGSFRSFSCMKILKWSFADSAMVSDNSLLHWSSWFTAWNRLVSGVGDLILRCFLDFLFLCSKAVSRRSSVKKVLLEISQNSQENTFARDSVLIKLQACNFIKKCLWYRCFPVNFARFLRTPFFTKHLRWLLLWVSFLFFLCALLLLIVAGTGWEGATWRSGTDSLALLGWASLRRRRFFFSNVFVHLSYFLKDLHCHLH